MVFSRNDVWGTNAKIPYWWRLTTQIWVVLLIEWSRFPTSQKYYPDVASDTSSVWNFCARFSEVISLGNQWWSRKMSAVCTGYVFNFSVFFVPLKLRANGSNNSQHCWELLRSFWQWCANGCDNSQQHAARSNKVCKRTQHVTFNNVWSCWPTMFRPFAWDFT